jgi:hypothetical protein
MRIELRCFTGTGNTLKVINTCDSAFTESGNHTNISEISSDETIFPDADESGLAIKECDRILNKRNCEVI